MTNASDTATIVRLGSLNLDRGERVLGVGRKVTPFCSEVEQRAAALQYVYFNPLSLGRRWLCVNFACLDRTGSPSSQNAYQPRGRCVHVRSR
jgi:hypothetical protein